MAVTGTAAIPPASPIEAFLGPNLVGKDGIKFTTGFDLETSAYLALGVLLAVIFGIVIARALCKALNI